MVTSATTTVERQVSPPRKRSQTRHSRNDGDLEADHRDQEGHHQEGRGARQGQQARAGECLGVVVTASHEEQQQRQPGDQHAGREGPQPGARLAERAEAVAQAHHDPGDAQRDPDQRRDDLVRRAAAGRPLLGEVVGDLRPELLQQVRLRRPRGAGDATGGGRPGRWGGAHRRLLGVSGALLEGTAGRSVRSGRAAQADAVLVEQVGVALAVLLEHRDDLVPGDLERGQVVLLVEVLVLLRREGLLETAGQGVDDVLRACRAARSGSGTARPRPPGPARWRSRRRAASSTRSGPKTVSGVSLPASIFSTASPSCSAADVDLAAEDGGQRGRAAVEGHVGRVHAEVAEQQRLGQLAAGADAGGAVLQRVRRPAGPRWSGTRCRRWSTST